MENTEKKVLIRKPFIIAAAVLLIVVIFLIWLVYYSGISEYDRTQALPFAGKTAGTWEYKGDVSEYDDISGNGLTMKFPSGYQSRNGIYIAGDSTMAVFLEPYNDREEHPDTFDITIRDTNIFAQEDGAKVESVYDLRRFVYGLDPADSPKIGKNAKKFLQFAELKNDLMSGNEVFYIDTGSAKGFIMIMDSDGKYSAEAELFPDVSPDICYSVKVISDDKDMVMSVIGTVDVIGNDM